MHIMRLLRTLLRPRTGRWAKTGWGEGEGEGFDKLTLSPRACRGAPAEPLVFDAKWLTRGSPSQTFRNNRARRLALPGSVPDHCADCRRIMAAERHGCIDCPVKPEAALALAARRSLGGPAGFLRRAALTIPDSRSPASAARRRASRIRRCASAPGSQGRRERQDRSRRSTAPIRRP